MNHTKCRIAVFYGVHDNTHRKQIVNLIQRLILVHHLFINTEKVFYATADFGFDADVANLFPHFFNNAVNKLGTLLFPKINLLLQFLTNLRLQIPQG